MNPRRPNRLPTQRLAPFFIHAAITAAIAANLAAATGCGGAPSGRYDESPGGYSQDGGAVARQCFGANDCSAGSFCNGFGVCVPLPTDQPDLGLPPEVELRTETPSSSERFVYVAVSNQDSVVKIDSRTLRVSTLEVGADPGALRTVPGKDVAVVLNRAADTASILRTRDDGGDDIITLPTQRGLNALTMSPDGRYALAWFDLAQSAGRLPLRQTFQDVTLVALEAGKEQAIDLSVGFKPFDVQFAPDGNTCWVINEEGVSTIDLRTPPKASIVPTTPVRKDPLTEPVPDEVLVTRDGTLAIARLPGHSLLRAVDLRTRAIIDLPLAGEPTDVDLSGDGALAIAVLRDASQIVLVDLPGDLADPAKIDVLDTLPYAVGQAELTADSKAALLYTNATTQKAILVADLEARAIEVYPLKKGVRQVRVAPDGKSAVLVHNRVPGAPSPNDPLDVYLDKLEAYSLFALDGGYAKLQPTDAPPGPMAFAADGATGYLLIEGGGVHSVEALDLRAFLVRSVTLGSPPVAVGVVPSTQQVFVAQDHPRGRMTFVDTTTFMTRTLTGFGLNGGIIE